MNFERFIDEAEQRKAQQEQAKQAALSAEEMRLKLNGEKVSAKLREEALPVLLDAAVRLNLRGYSADVTSIKSELHSPNGVPYSLVLTFRMSNDPKVKLLLCTLTYRGDCTSAVVTTEFKTMVASMTEAPVPFDRVTGKLVEQHVEKLVEWAFQEPTDLSPV